MIHALWVVCQYVDLTLLYEFRCWMEIEEGIFYYAVNFIFCIKLYFMKQSSSKHEIKHNKTFASLHWNLLPPRTHPKNLCTLNWTSDDTSDGTLPAPPKRIQKICVHSPIHTTNWNIRWHLGRHPARQPPQETNQKIQRTHPWPHFPTNSGIKYCHHHHHHPLRHLQHLPATSAIKYHQRHPRPRPWPHLPKNSLIERCTPHTVPHLQRHPGWHPPPPETNREQPEKYRDHPPQDLK